MALRQQIVKYVTMGVTKSTSGDYHPDNRHSVNWLEDSITWCLHALSTFFFKTDPIITELKVTQFMLDNEHPFKEFAPDIFQELRSLDGIHEKHYMKALEKTEKEQLSEGASGAFMFFCGNMEFIVKTIKASEANVLHRSLRHYLAYLKQNPKSLLVRFLGSYSLDVYAQTFHFVVMRNIFEPNIDINERFDIKGSWINRHANTSPPNKSIVCRHCNEVFVPSAKEKCGKIIGLHEGNVVLKDNDLRVKISLQRSEAIDVLDILKKDSDLLAQMGVLDYRSEIRRF
jgi:1-phosphatidylinositol-4-phosphate 5-kinase